MENAGNSLWIIEEKVFGIIKENLDKILEDKEIDIEIKDPKESISPEINPYNYKIKGSGGIIDIFEATIRNETYNLNEIYQAHKSLIESIEQYSNKMIFKESINKNDSFIRQRIYGFKSNVPSTLNEREINSLIMEERSLIKEVINRKAGIVIAYGTDKFNDGRTTNFVSFSIKNTSAELVKKLWVLTDKKELNNYNQKEHKEIK